jgi:hypothetical protein
MTQFKVFYLPKPWPLWMPWIPPESRPIKLQSWLYGLAGMLAISLIILSPLYVRPTAAERTEYAGVEQNPEAV